RGQEHFQSFLLLVCTPIFIYKSVINTVDCSEYKRLERGRPIYCERLYQPFCGSDGKTYNNKCSFCKLYTAVSQSLNFIHPACSDDGEQGTK
uniref:Ovomucoid n=1 Tax=Aquila chrysaetos chrysaetos TaxID=223781 RepID=A0A663FIB6_AQUCH